MKVPRSAHNETLHGEVQAALKWLRAHSTQATLEGMARYAIPADTAYGVAMKDIKALGARLGRNQELAAALWDTKVYEARMLASFVGDPASIKCPAQPNDCGGARQQRRRCGADTIEDTFKFAGPFVRASKRRGYRASKFGARAVASFADSGDPLATP